MPTQQEINANWINFQNNRGAYDVGGPSAYQQSIINQGQGGAPAANTVPAPAPTPSPAPVNNSGNQSALNRIFQEELGRDIGAEGLQYFGNDLAGGQSLAQIRRSIQNSAEAQGNRQSNAPPIGLVGSEQALRSGLEGSLAGITEGLDRAGESIAQGQQFLQPFAGAGGQAIGLQAALSGAAGAEAQQQAFANYTASPGQEFLRNRGERALLRNSGAIGGLGGGRVRQALQQQGIGLAQQDFNNQFNRLGQLSQFGLQGAGQQAQLSGQLAGEQGLGS